MTKKLNFGIVILLVASLLVVSGCGGTTDKKAELEKLKKEHDALTEKIKLLEEELAAEGQSTLKITPVMVTEMKSKPFYHYIEVQGKVDGDENIAVSSRSAGFVTSINVQEGQTVRRGQLLATLDAQVLYQTLNELEATLIYVTDIYERQKNLWDQKIGSEVQYLTAKNNKESMENKIRTLKEQIAMTRITSPINGTVEEIPIKIGQSVVPGVTAFRVVNFSKIKVMAEVAEAYSPKVKTGDSVLIRFPDFNYEISTKLTFTSKYINPTNRTFLVEARLAADKYNYRANMIAVLKINDYKVDSALQVPINVVQKTTNEQFVFIAEKENGKSIARKRIVVVGMTYNGMAEITGGLQAGDKVITTGYQGLNDGQLIDF